MPRATKKVPFTGSMLLGAELRRLRGTRTYQEIAGLTKLPPLAGKVAPLSISALSEIECGKQMPRLETLLALSMVYRVSMNQLMGYVMEERMVNVVARTAMPAGEVLDAEFARLLSIGAWHEALPLAVHAERLATTEEARIACRANRASCLANLGQRDEAFALLTSCLESPAVTRAQELAILRNLADIQAAGGNYKSASGLIREAMERLSASEGTDQALFLDEYRAKLIVEIQEDARERDERALREAMRLSQRVEEAADQIRPTKMKMRLLRARALELLGNTLVATRDFELLMSEAVEYGYPRLESLAAFYLGRARGRAGHLEQADALLTRSLNMAERANQIDIQFEAALRLFELHRNTRPGHAVTFLRKCRALAPFVARGSGLREFESLQAEFAS